ncbi:hypothetical protein [Erythrobacter crassostreae]|uniref:Uncharacterized protein n=1 Tax=Erythrobacter crassostreae TaxID=2828328 RepID=A0A9X1JP33_9SPHN|nr:hypothetical protein [Erythrobacter crassostrea]MBV7259012.1 hypothetical protein [Erythrobacter crassostrea]
MQQRVEEFQKRLSYLAANYSFCKQISEGRQSFNDSIETIGRSLTRKRRSSLELKRVHLVIEVEITKRARILAEPESREVRQSDIDNAAAELLGSLSKLRGAPKNGSLRYHVAGLIALIQQFSGHPVLAHRGKPGEYAPHFVSGVSQIVPHFFEQVDPKVRLMTLVECAISIRTEYAGKRLDFLDLFPMYGTVVDSKGELRPGPGIEIKAFDKNISLYSR